jgi:acyl-CoA synthetase (AMP-forming)/AMP-acid ligase II/aryl carrier-like protein
MLWTFAQRQPAAPALLSPDREPTTYAQLWTQVQGVARLLRRKGIARGERVAIVMPNGEAAALAFLGVSCCAVAVPIPPASTASEMQSLMHDARVRLVITNADPSPAAVSAARELGLATMPLEPGAAGLDAPGVGAPVDFAEAADVALVLHTSGTTAAPKRVPLTHANLRASAVTIAQQLALGPCDRCLNVMPLFHVHGLVGAVLASLSAGASVVCLPGFDATGFFDAVARFQPTWYTAVPTLHHAVVEHGASYRLKAPAHRFRFIRSCSASLPARTLEALESLTGAPVIEAYGMTEMSHQLASNPLPPGVRKAGTVGVAVGAEIAIVDPSGVPLPAGQCGEIVARGPGLIAGYEDNPQADALAFRNGWFRTGDEGRLDADGRLTITGRLKEMINRGGEKIAPREIDDALLAHPEILEAAAYAVPHPTLGEDLAAVVVAAPGSAVDEAALRAFLAKRLAVHKLPSTIMRVAAIPKAATGKVQRTNLHREFTALRNEDGAPADAIERSLAAIFSDVLGAATVGRHDNFFACGGDSLKAAQVVSRVRAQHGIELPVPVLFQHPTVAELAALARAAKIDLDARTQALIAEIEGLSDEEVARLLAQEDGEFA